MMEWSPLLISIRTACTAFIITFFIGILLARWVVSLKNKTWQIIIDGILTLPLVLPPTVVGFFLLYLFGVQRPLGRFLLELGIQIVFTWQATVLAAIVISLPLMYRSARGAFEQIDQTYIHAAQTLGLSNRYIFWRVTLPLAFPGITTGGILSFARGLGEFGATAMIAGNIAGTTRTLPLEIYSLVASGRMDDAYFYVFIIVLISFAIVILMNIITFRQQRTIKGERK